MIRDDDPLFEKLGHALAPAEVSPTPAEIAALRRAVARRFGGQRRAFWRRPLVALAAAATLTFAGTALGVVSGALNPTPVRSIAHAVGLPVESPALAETRISVRRVREALARKDAGEVRAGVADLRGRLGALEEADLRAIGDEGSALLGEAAVLAMDEAVKALHASAPAKQSRPRRTISSADDNDEDRSRACDDDEDDEDDEDGADHADPLPSSGDDESADPLGLKRGEGPDDGDSDAGPGDDDDDATADGEDDEDDSDAEPRPHHEEDDEDADE